MLETRIRDPLFAGLDVSTQSCKLVVIDPAAAGVVRVDQVDYDRDLPDHGTVEGAVPEASSGTTSPPPKSVGF